MIKPIVTARGIGRLLAGFTPSLNYNSRQVTWVKIWNDCVFETIILLGARGRANSFAPP